MAVPESGNIAVLAEKPSVARDIAHVLGATGRGDGYLHGNGYVVSWAIGHLVALAQPHEMNPEWRHWRRDLLPILPKRWPLVVYEKTKDQFEIVRKILGSPRVSRVVCATDAGREGELIFRYIYEAAQCGKSVSRLWISSLTPDSIRKGFDTLRPSSDYDALADAARGRSRADWLVGMNLSRAYSLAYNEELSVGRVQTPTLAIVVERELAIRSFVAEDYLEILAHFRPTSGTKESTYQGTWFRTQPEGASDKESLQAAMRLPVDGEEASRVVDRARTGNASIESIQSETQRMVPPQLYDLTELQRHANRLFGFSAQKTLDTAQALYERHKLISYPRTDSRHLSQDVAGTLPRIVKVIEGPFREHLAAGTGERPLGRRFIDDSRVTDHHAIIPTLISPEKTGMSAEERKIYDLICRRLLSAWQEDHIWLVTTVITAVRNGDIIDRYHTSGSAVQQVGWKALDISVEKKTKTGKVGSSELSVEQVLPPGLALRPAAGFGRHRSLEKEDSAAQAPHGSDTTDCHGDGGQNCGREGTVRGDEGDWPWNAGHARSYYRSLAEARLYCAQRQESRGDGKGYPSYRSRSRRSQEPRHDRAMGGVSQEYPAGDGPARAISEGYRGLRAGSCGQGGADGSGSKNSRGSCSRPRANHPCRAGSGKPR